jgi:nucleoside-diphosphate-sugar epimerase
MRAGVHCRWGNLTDPEVAASLLSDCDLIFDLALPNGKNLRETRKMLHERLTSIFFAARPIKGFVLASTTAVYRYNASQPFFRAYRSMKLFAERLSRSLGTKYGLNVYVFRLGQVYGALQSCSESVRQGLLRNAGAVHVPDQNSDAIFVSSIAEAIRAVLFDEVPPNTYTMISQPPWSCADLIELHARRLGLEARVILESPTTISPFAHAVSAVSSWLKQGQSEFVNHQKELLSAIVSTGSEELDQKLRFVRNRKIAAATISGYFESLRYRPFSPSNEIPGTRFPFSSGSEAATMKAEQAVGELIENLLVNCPKGLSAS